MFQYRHASWWYWLATVPLLIAGLSGRNEAFYWAMGLTVVQWIHFALRDRNAVSFPVQVRMGYLGLLLLGQWEPLYFIYYIQLIGTSAMVLFGYCPLARFMSLMPWNRSEPFSRSLVMRTILAPPTRGSILQGLPPEPARAV
ncbi:hypothetical protein SCL_1906 [Sulfuricaulis limicola]|uniref:Uncharacterized protein n=1 Tax=Sulfuricaulis limicola TaxID=1620215 RepID=A0A1B4XHE4_9GAMM|nr:hypothetical protein [Sulfuricaulis limicola]BAV34197.1 hypothetical protein SCL_1906 [Sulfuricaulis limicola]